MTRSLRLIAALLALHTVSCSGDITPEKGEVGEGPGASQPDARISLPDGDPVATDVGPAPDQGAKGADRGPEAGLTILSIKADPVQIAPGGSVSLTVQLRNDTDQPLVDGELSIEAKCPDGRLFDGKTPGVDLGPHATGEVKQLRGPYTVVGGWVFTPRLRAGGALLATGPSVTVKVVVPPITNPLTGIVGYTQISLSSTTGSCGSHSGAVALAYLKGLRNDVPAATAIEKAIYAKVPYAPGEPALKTGYDSYMNGSGVPYKSVSIGASSVLSTIKAGSPVVAHVYNHYVCLYGLNQESGTWYVYFSDGATGYGTSGSWSVGAGGHLRKMGWSAFQNKMYGGYIGFSHK